MTSQVRAVPTNTIGGETVQANEERHRQAVAQEQTKAAIAIAALRAQTATLAAISRALAIEVYGSWGAVPAEMQAQLDSFSPKTLSHRGS